MKQWMGQPAASGKLGIVVARFNELVTRSLLQGALHTWEQFGGDGEEVEVCWVPGAFELGLVAQKMAASKRFSAVVCLGCVIRGSTGHYDHVCSAATSGVLQAGLTTGVPVIFGVLTTDNLEQALERAGSKAGNKGSEAVLSAMEMADLMQRFPA